MARWWPDGRTRESRLTAPRLLKDGDPRGWPWTRVIFDSSPYSWLLVNDLASQPWFAEAIRDPDVRAVYHWERGLQGLSINLGGTKRARIQDSRAVWGMDAGTAERLIPQLCAYLDAGTWAYPSTLGLETMRREYPPELPTIAAPLGQNWRILQETMTGGRVDTLRQGERFERVWELDMNMAYAAAMRNAPAGYPRRCYGVIHRGGPTYAHYNWEIRHPLTLGPLHLRDATGTLSWPSAVSRGEGWYWDIEAEAAQEQGVEMTPDWGIVWPQSTNAFAGWAEKMWQLRRDAPAELADLVKLVVVAGIGALGTTRKTVRIAALAEQPSFEPMHDSAAGFSHEWGIEYGPAREGGLLHIASYVRAVVRTWLFRRALPYAQRGLLVATDYDALRITDKPYLELAELRDGLGGWKAKELHNVTIAKPRWIESDEKTRTPGVSR